VCRAWASPDVGPSAGPGASRPLTLSGPWRPRAQAAGWRFRPVQVGATPVAPRQPRSTTRGEERQFLAHHVRDQAGADACRSGAGHGGGGPPGPSMHNSHRRGGPSAGSRRRPGGEIAGEPSAVSGAGQQQQQQAIGSGPAERALPRSLPLRRPGGRAQKRRSRLTRPQLWMRLRDRDAWEAAERFSSTPRHAGPATVDQVRTSTSQHRHDLNLLQIRGDAQFAATPLKPLQQGRRPQR